MRLSELIRRDLELLNEVNDTWYHYLPKTTAKDALGTNTKEQYEYMESFGYDFKKSQNENINLMYDERARKKAYDERQELYDDIEERKYYIENVYGDIETLIEDDELNITEEEFLNNKDVYKNYLPSDDSIEEELRQSDGDKKLIDEVNFEIYDALTTYRDYWIDDFRMQLLKYGIETSSPSESKRLISTYLSIDTDREGTDSLEIRFSDHSDHYPSNDRLCYYYQSNPIEVANLVLKYLKNNFEMYQNIELG